MLNKTSGIESRIPRIKNTAINYKTNKNKVK